MFLDKCLICLGSRLKALKGYEKDYLCRCLDCSFVFAQQVPTPEELHLEYLKYPRDDTLSPITHQRYVELLQTLEGFRQHNRILDVGAGNGHFGQAAQAAGWQAFATEFDERAVEFCRQKGITTHSGALQLDNYEAESFDLIYSSEVLEHIQNPLEELKTFWSLLRPGGAVYLTTPNLNALSHWLLGPRWNNFNYPEHLCFYNPKTLLQLFFRCGFKPLWISTTGFSPANFAISSQLPVSGPSDEALRARLEGRGILSSIKKLLNAFLNQLGLGDAMKGLFVKA